ncbi:MAG: amino acid permease [bacterium]|nr:amino acid permease [bacterium]
MSSTEQHEQSPDGESSLHRTLGIVGVLTLSIGAMIGSGIFVLPSLAFKIAGPAAILAFVIAGIVVLPAVFSKAEMATAMPAAGGTYLFIDRAMGPMMGTIAGFGVWFSLTFKAAFALVGLSAYLSLFFTADPRLVGLLITVALIVLNLVGVKQSTVFQAILVTAVLIVLAVFVVAGTPEIDTASFEPFLSKGNKALFSAAAVVFVSYAGVTKIASIAEEVREPDRNIPRGMFISIGLMILLYPAVVAIMVGVTPAADLAATTTPVATAAKVFLGSNGEFLISATAVVALISMGNAGLVASARYPFAMSRNQLAPAYLSRVGKKSGAPNGAIITTGVVLGILVAFVPLLELAKLASAFQLLVFAFENLALIAFRESGLAWYRPTFHSPAYPYVQVFGIIACLGLLTQIGLVPTVGAIAFIGAGILWYRGFGQARASRESAARDALRMRAQDRYVADTKAAVASTGVESILVVLRRPARLERQQTLVRLALHLAAAPGGRLHVMHFDDQLGVGVPSQDEIATAAQRGVEVTVEYDPDGDRRGKVHLYAERNNVDLVLADLPQELSATRHILRDWRWLQEHLPSDSAFIRNRHIEGINTIAVMGTGGPYDPLKLMMASRIAKNEDARLRLIHVAQGTASEEQIAAIHDYHERLIATLDVPAESQVEAADNLVETLTRLSRGANLVVLGAPSHRFHVVTDLADRIAEGLDCPSLLVHTPVHDQMSLRRRIIEQFIS